MAVATYVGSFSEPGSTGDIDVTVSGLTDGKVLFLWGMGGVSSGTFRASIRAFVGFCGKNSASAITNWCMSIGVQDNNTTSNSSRRVAEKAISLVTEGEATISEATLVSFGSGKFTLNFSSVSGTGYLFHYMVIEGSSVYAEAYNFTKRTSAGNQTISGRSVAPDLCLFAATGGQTGTPPTSAASAQLFFGASNSVEHWCAGIFDVDAQATSEAWRGHADDACLLVQASGTGAYTGKATMTSMTSDGFVLNWSAASATASHVIVLMIEGVISKLSTFAKNTGGAPVTDTTAALGFAPLGAILASVSNTSNLSSAGAAQGRLSIGASDGSNHAASIFNDQDASAISSVDSMDKSTVAIMTMNNGTPTLEAEATIGFNPTTADIDWSLNDASAKRVSYLMIGDPPILPGVTIGGITQVIVAA